MTVGPRQGIVKLRATARRLLWGALVCLVVPAVAWLGSALFAELGAGGGGSLLELVSALLVLYMAPVGVVLLILGLIARGWCWWLERDLDRRGVD